jgi:hypothetical protein
MLLNFPRFARARQNSFDFMKRQKTTRSQTRFAIHLPPPLDRVCARSVCYAACVVDQLRGRLSVVSLPLSPTGVALMQTRGAASI